MTLHKGTVGDRGSSLQRGVLCSCGICCPDQRFGSKKGHRACGGPLGRHAVMVWVWCDAGRGLQLVRVTVGGVGLLAATTHLESPLGHSDMQSTPRVAQCKQVRC